MTRLDLINLGLLKAGITQTVVDLTEGTREAFAAAKLYDPTRREVLRAYPWPFATVYTSPDLVEGDDTVAAVARADGAVEWQYAYEYPPDVACLFARRLVGANGRRFDPNPLVWRVGRVGASTIVIFTNVVDPLLEYTGDVDLNTNPPEPLFEAAFTQLLGSRLALSLARDAKLSLGMYQQYLLELPWAKTISAREEQPEPPTDSASWHRDR
jgi:hypothetical protein